MQSERTKAELIQYLQEHHGYPQGNTLVDMLGGYHAVMSTMMFSENLSGLRGKKVLDIGCGAEMQGEGYRPTFAYAAAAAGASTVLGIDRGRTPQYEVSEYDATRPLQFLQTDADNLEVLLNALPQNEFDIVTMMALIDHQGPGTSQILWQKLNKSLEKITNLLMLIRIHAGALLKDGGVYVENKTIFPKEKGRLSRILTLEQYLVEMKSLPASEM